LVEQGATLKKEGKRFVVEKGGKIIFEIPAFKIERVLIFGNIQITTQAISFLLSNRIETSFLTIRGELKGQLIPPKSKNVILRMTQFEKAKDKEFTLNLAKRIVANKISNSLEIVKGFSYNHPEINLTEEKKKIKEVLESVDRKNGIKSLLGIEGIATVNYFKALAKTFIKGLTFSGRNRRPPRDPVNSLLSFGYTLAGNEILSLLQATGFDPYIGFYHGIDYGRPSLALDILEEFRHTLIDRFVLFLSNNSILKNEDFEEVEGGVYLKKESRKVFFKYYEQWLNREIKDHIEGNKTTFRKLFLSQIHRLADCITKGEEYIPYRICS